MLHNKAFTPIAVFSAPVVLFCRALLPTATFDVPVVFNLKAQVPTAVLFEAVLQNND